MAGEQHIVMADTTDVTFTKVRLPNGWLGNMAPFPIRADGRIWRTSEALFQARRFTDERCITAIHECRSPMHAKMVAKGNIERAVITPWSDADVDNMRAVIRLKIDQHPSLKDKLLALHGRIVEDCSLRPAESALFWGARRRGDVWEGKNMLGVLWMELREELAQRLSARTQELLDLKEKP